ncbi:pleckstrin homology domain-containing family G member 4B-like [Sinocyclocheilus anshuiensis]|uniref:pleckstrin homology domain-containing family G member 4B-like n=1 Tax=Sinocyclocheilus anshuiensis TaxID=1608454 RepID=UPI0007B8AF23|nr:PREDICTED: pleckstrin homology domain-containing family G member 4B-like [Sinocyclocheilus anshuiensis]
MRTRSIMHSRVKSRSCDNYLSIKDSESLDRCIRSVLSALYPPFSASAATVLWQLFSVVERQYRGDGLHCFIDFLLPAKRILQTITQEACLRFKGLLLYHEGWPLSLHEKVVLQLAPLHKVRLRQGDFYLQVVPLGRKAAKLVIKCLSGSGQAIVEIPVAESMYGSVFTPDFLQNVMRERNLHPLQNCLLSTGAVVYRTPWKNVVNPLFVTSTADSIMQARSSGGTLRGQLSTCSTHGSTGTLSSRDSLGAESTVSEPVLSRSLTDMGISSLHSEDSPLQKSPNSLPQTPTLGSPDQGCIRGRIGHKILSFSTDLSNPGLHKRHPRDSAAFESRRLFRKSYMEALQNPMNLGSSSESVLEEGTESEPGAPRGSGPKEPIPRRICVRGWLGGDESCNDSTAVHPSKSAELSPGERRSKSLERAKKALQVKGHRARSSSGGSGSGLPKKLMNGYAFRFGKLDLEAAFPGIEKRSNKENSGLCDDRLHSSPRRNRNSGDEFVSSRSAVSPALPSLITHLNQELLTSGALTLPGNQDRGGRAVLQVCSRSQVWTDAAFTTNQISELLCYFCGRLRREKRGLGLTVLIDARRQPVTSALFTAMSELQTLVPNALYSVLILVDRDAAVKVERDVSVPCEVLTSLKALQKHIDSSQLTRDFDGSFPYEHSHYIHFRQKIEAFAASCSAAIASLQSSIETLNNIGSLETSEEVSEVISQQKSLMKSVLDDTKLNRLRLEGGTFLARIRKEEMCENENYRDAVDLVGALYNQLDEEVHKLVILSNKSLQQLEKLLELCVLQERHQEVKRWFYVESEKHLAPLDSYSLSLSCIQDMRQSLAQFMEESTEQQKKAAALPREAEAGPALLEVKEHISSVLQRSETRKHELDVLLNLYEFYESAKQWMEHCQEYFCQLRLDGDALCLTPAELQVLQDYHSEATKFSLENFSSLNQMVLKLDSEREQQRWSSVWQQCQQTRQQLEEMLDRAVKASVNSIWTKEHREVNNGLSGRSRTGRQFRNGIFGRNREKLERTQGQERSLGLELDTGWCSGGADTGTDEGGLGGLFRDSGLGANSGTNSWTRAGSRLSSGVLLPKVKKLIDWVHDWPGALKKPLDPGMADDSVTWRRDNRVVDPNARLYYEERSQNRQGQNTSKHKIQHIMDEMISTEREYVRSLSYIIQHYFPEMERLDLPQDLRGKRSIIFGNLEKLCDFHSQYFLTDLESCAHSPLSISICFLKHEEQFGMYALYSKNKPRSDALLTSHGNSFFKNKQLELGDKMDLASYLLKPIQRMSKYALLLKDLIKECGQSQEQELADLRTAQEMVRFQLRHGNDLLAMDAIRGCDVRLI